MEELDEAKNMEKRATIHLKAKNKIHSVAKSISLYVVYHLFVASSS